MKNFFPTFSLIFFLFLTLVSCSSEQDENDKNVITQGTETVAKEAVKSIKTPLDQARGAAEQEDDHSKQIKEQTQ